MLADRARRLQEVRRQRERKRGERKRHLLSTLSRRCWQTGPGGYRR